MPADGALAAGAARIIAPSPLAGEGMMAAQRTRLGEGFKPIEQPLPLTHQKLLQCLLALSRRKSGLPDLRILRRDPRKRGARGRGHNKARRTRGSRLD
jgi:hypothetical protein